MALLLGGVGAADPTSALVYPLKIAKSHKKLLSPQVCRSRISPLWSDLPGANLPRVVIPATDIPAGKNSEEDIRDNFSSSSAAGNQLKKKDRCRYRSLSIFLRPPPVTTQCSNLPGHGISCPKRPIRAGFRGGFREDYVIRGCFGLWQKNRDTRFCEYDTKKPAPVANGGENRLCCGYPSREGAPTTIPPHPFLR